MGCSITDQIVGYKAVSKNLRELNPKVEPVRLQHAINNYWLGLENNIMTESEKKVYKLLVEQTDGMARIGLGGNKQLNESIVVIKDLGNEYVVHLESGKNYTFAKGKINSKTTAKGQSVTMEAMVLTDPKQMMYQQNGTKGEFDKELDNKLRDILQKLYPEIKLEYTEQEILHGEGVMNQEVVSNTVKLSLKVVEALSDWATAKPSKHGGTSQPVLSTVRVNQEAGIRKRLAGKDVPKEQIDFVFEYMRQNDIGEISTRDLAERVLIGLATVVEVNTTTQKPKSQRNLEIYESRLKDNLKHIEEIKANNLLVPIGLTNDTADLRNHIKQMKQNVDEKTEYYIDLAVPGGTNYQEKEIATPSMAAPLKGHAKFATDKGIGWYRVDDAVTGGVTVALPNEFKSSDGSVWKKINEVWNILYHGETEFTVRDDLSDSEARFSYPGDLRTKGGTTTSTLRVLEMQSDLFQKMKDDKLDKQGVDTITMAEESVEYLQGELDKEYPNTKEWDNINTQLKDAVKYLNNLKNSKDLNKSFLQLLNTDNKWVKFFIQSIVQDSQKKGYKKIMFPGAETVAKIEGYTKEHGSEAVKDFYQNRVRNTLMKTYGRENVKTITDEYGNQWFELELDAKRDSNVIMLQKQEGQIKGQADIEAKTVLINSLLQSQDTLPHEYAHHYIRWFKDTPIVQEAINKWGSEEALVQAIGEQVVQQKGEVYGWWKKFTAMVQKWFDTNFSKADKEDLKNMLTDAFLERKDLDNKNSDTKMGSDQNTGIGETASDVFLGQEELELGQVLADEFDGYYEADVQEGREIQTQEFKDLQKYIVETYQQTMQNLGTGNVKLRMFENLTEQTAGQIDLRTNEMHIRWNTMSRLSRVSEVFLHEVNHSMSHHVFKENIKLRRIMEDLRDSALKSGVNYKVFIEGIQNPTAEEIEIAKMKFEYTFDKTANVEEFYAYATTNENVYNAVKDIEITSGLVKELELDPKNKEPFKKVLNILIKEINRLWRLLSGRGDTGGKIIVDMISTIAKLDAEMAQKKSQVDNSGLGISDYAKGKISALDESLEPVIKKVSDWNDKLSAKQSASWLGEKIRKIPVLNDLLETGISQYLWRMVTQDTTANDVADMYMIFRHSKQVVEKHTADIRNGVKAVATDLYKDLDTPTKNAVTRVILEADLAHFDAEEIKSLLENPKNIDDKINKLKAELEIKPNSDMLKQIEGLAEYLVSGKTVNYNQQINANNIVVGLYKEQRKYKPANKNKVKLVDKLVSLIALKNSDSVQVELLKNVDNEILDKTINMYRGYMDSMRENATIDAHDPIQKGYTRPEDGLIKYELIPEEEVKAQQSVLMKLVNEKPYAVIEGKRYYLMTGRTKSVGFTEGAIGLISHTAEGIPLSSLIRKNNELKGKLELMDGELKRRTREIILSISRQEKVADKYFKLGEGQTLVPVYDHQNNLVDYRIQLNKLEKEVNLPDRKTELEDVLSHTFSRSIKTSLTATENKKVIDTIIEHTAAGILERPQDYVLIEEYTETDRLNGVKREKRHDRWEYLPDHTKDYIFQKSSNKDNNKHKGIFIHKDFVELMTGEKDVTIGNFAKFGIDLRKYPVARARLMALESYLAEILGYVKNAMVVLNADVLLGNQTSNAMVAITHGIDPIDYAKKFKTRWQQLNEYNEKLQQLAELEVRKMAGESVDSKIKQLNRQLEGNTWNELVKDGQYTALVEDINVESQGEGQLMTMAKDYLEKKNWLGAINTVKNVLYINRTTSLYNSMLKTVHYGDAITRQIIKEELEKKAIARDGELKSEVEREILNYLDQILVNYGYTMNRWWKYAERVGGLFFMKYYLSQAKAIMSMTKKNPTRMGLMQGAQQLTGMDVQDPLDTYLRSGIDGVAYRFLFDDAPEQILQPNIFDLIPSLDSIVKIR